MSTPRKEFWAGVRAVLPLMLGVAPFGMIYGVLALANGLPPLAAQAISSIVFAGSAQFIAVGLFGAGSPLLVLWVTTFVVNIRHMLYSASVAPYTKHLSRKWRWLLAYLLTDEAFVIAILHYEDEKTAVAILNSLYQAHHDTPQATVDAPLYAALTGVPKEPPIPKILGIIGKQRALTRLGKALRN